MGDIETARALHRSALMQVPVNKEYADALARVLAVAEAAVAVSEGSYTGKHDPGEYGTRRRKLDAAVAALRTPPETEGRS